MSEVVECIECAEQFKSHNTDSGSCTLCGGECWDLNSIYGKDGTHPDPDFYNKDQNRVVNIKKGDRVRVISRPEGQTSSLADAVVGDEGIVQYVDGCCLCVKTQKDEFTANASRFELIK